MIEKLIFLQAFSTPKRNREEERDDAEDHSADLLPITRLHT